MRGKLIDIIPIVNHNSKVVDKDAANYSNQTILCTVSWTLDQTRCGSFADSIHIKPQGPEGTCPLHGFAEEQLDDAALFRQQAYVNGQWVDAKDGKTFDVTGIPH